MRGAREHRGSKRAGLGLSPRGSCWRASRDCGDTGRLVRRGGGLAVAQPQKRGVVLKGHRKGVGCGSGVFGQPQTSLSSSWLLLGGPFWRGRPDTGQWWLQSALCPLLTSGNLGKCGFGPWERDSCLSWPGWKSPAARQQAVERRQDLPCLDSSPAGTQCHVRPWHCQYALGHLSGTRWEAQGSMGPP